MAAADRLARAGETEALRALLDEARTSILADPIAGYREVMETAPAADQEIMADPAWQAAFTRGICEALAPGVDGWLDEVLAISGDWPDVDPTAVTSSVTWWHGDADRNCPFSAARRLVGRLPDARLIVSTESGHLVADGGEGEILDELLARARPVVAAG